MREEVIRDVVLSDLRIVESVHGFGKLLWKSRVQPIVATSSTEAEFYAAVTTAKIVKYLRYVLTELDSLRPGPTRLLIDNIAALNMINESRPTPRACHFEIKHSPFNTQRRQFLSCVFGNKIVLVG